MGRLAVVDLRDLEGMVPPIRDIGSQLDGCDAASPVDAVGATTTLPCAP